MKVNGDLGTYTPVCQATEESAYHYNVDLMEILDPGNAATAWEISWISTSAGEIVDALRRNMVAWIWKISMKTSEVHCRAHYHTTSIAFTIDYEKPKLNAVRHTAGR